MTERPKVLAVDDEQAVLEGLRLNLRKKYEVSCCTGGEAALDLLAREPDHAVIISDMRMPGMSGATFLARAREVVPDASRLLLTGQADLESAIAAVNEGQIYRFLTKPCPPPVLQSVVDDATELHRLVTSEKVLLEKTLRGAVNALSEVLALASPDFFGRGTRIKNRVCALSERLGLPDRWQLEVAAVFSQLGYVSLPPELVGKLIQGANLEPAEQQVLERIPRILEQLLAPIPRLERVLRIVLGAAKPGRSRPKEVDALLEFRQTQLLRVAIDFESLESTGLSPELALQALRGRSGAYDGEALDALAELLGAEKAGNAVHELPLANLRVGMILLQEVKTKAGILVVPKGYEVTASFIERMKNYPPGTLPNSVRALVRG